MQVQVGVVQIESNDVVNAIAGVVSKCSINKLVIGTSTPGLFSRYQLYLLFKIQKNKWLVRHKNSKFRSLESAMS